MRLRRSRRGRRWRRSRRGLLADRGRHFLLRTAAANQQCNAGNKGEKGQRQWGSIIGMRISHCPIPMLAVLWERSYEAGVRTRSP
jgi:hypothetical protein